MKRILLLALIAVFFCTPTNLKSPTTLAQKTSQEISIAGLHERVKVRRDERGIPYIEAANDDDLYFAQGYVTAGERLFLMDFLRRAARGQLSEAFGAATLAEDKRYRILGLGKVADDAAAHLSPDMAAALEAYARGVNAYISSLTPETTPPEFQLLQYEARPWSPADSLAVGRFMAEQLSSTWQLDIMRAALAALPKEKRAALLPESSALDVLVVGSDKKVAQLPNPSQALLPSVGVLAELRRQIDEDQNRIETIGLPAHSETVQASNNWVVSGKRTNSGKPLLANDPHLTASAPNIWYLAELSAPGLHVAGATFPGSPGIIIGHNDRIAWGLTNLGPDVQDVYLEKFDKDNPRRYLTPSGWKDAEIRHEQIKVRKVLTQPQTEIQNLDVVVTRHGPIVLEQNGNRYALRWTALDPSLGENAAFLQINRATNWNEFTSALRTHGGIASNFIYADVDGHIGYYAGGAIPIRKAGDGSVPYDGATDDGEWTGLIPFEKLPHRYDPPGGIIVTANQRVVGSDYPYFISHHWAQPYRARRILDLLNEKPKLTIADYRRIQGDVYSIGLTSFARAAASILKAAPGPDDPKLSQTISALEKWDGQLNADSTLAPLVLKMRVAFRNRIFDAALGPDLSKIYRWDNSDLTVDRLIAQQPAAWLPKEFQSYADLLRACYQDARAALTRNPGPDEAKWKWGELYQVRFFHPLGSVPFMGGQFLIPPVAQNGLGGSGATVNVGANVSMRFIADLNDWDQTENGLQLGESGIPSSPHWKDQLDDWRNVTPRAFPFSKAAVEKAARETLILLPKS